MNLVTTAGCGVTGYIGIQRDVTEEVAIQRALTEKVATLESTTQSLIDARAELMQLAYFDALTGLATRRFFDERLLHGLARAARTEESLAALVLGLFGFKSIIDWYGHGAGDKVLQVIVSRLRVLVRECDTLARIGGDEFVLLMDTGVTADALESIIGRIEREVREPITLDKDAVSIGQALFPEDGTNSVDLVRVEDARMYEVKRRRKGGSFQARFMLATSGVGMSAKI